MTSIQVLCTLKPLYFAFIKKNCSKLDLCSCLYLYQSLDLDLYLSCIIISLTSSFFASNWQKILIFAQSTSHLFYSEHLKSLISSLETRIYFSHFTYCKCFLLKIYCAVAKQVQASYSDSADSVESGELIDLIVLAYYLGDLIAMLHISFIQ